MQIKGLLQRIFVEKSGERGKEISLQVDNFTGDLVKIDAQKDMPNSVLDKRKKDDDVQTKSMDSHLDQTLNISASSLPFMPPYVVKTGDIVSFVESTTSRSATNASNVGVMYVQKLPDCNNNNTSFVIQSSKSNNVNFNPPKHILSSQPDQNITVPKNIVSQTLNNISVSLTNQFSLPSIIQVCSFNTSVLSTLTTTAASIATAGEHIPHQVFHVGSVDRSISHGTMKCIAPTSCQSSVNNTSMQHHILSSIQNATIKTTVSNTYNTSIATPVLGNSKAQCGNNSVISSVLYIKPNEESVYDEIKEEETASCYLSFQQDSLSSKIPHQKTNNITVNTNVRNKMKNNNDFCLINKHESLINFTVSSKNACSRQTQPKVSICHTLNFTTQTENMLTHCITSGIMQSSSSDMQIVSTNIPIVQNNLILKESSPTIQSKVFHEQNVSLYSESVKSFSSNDSQSMLIDSNSNNQISASIEQKPIQQLQSFCQKGINQYKSSETRGPYQVLENNMDDNHSLTVYQNSSTAQNASDDAISSSFSTNHMQNLFVVSPLPTGSDPVCTSLHINPLQQSLSMTVFGQPTNRGDSFSHQLNKDQPGQTSNNAFQQGSQHMQHLFTSTDCHMSNSRNISDNGNEWEHSIDDSSKVDFLSRQSNVKDTQPASPMIMNIRDNEETDFMETLQQLNNDHQQYPPMPSTPVVTFDSNIRNYDSNSQQVAQIDNDLIDQDEFGTSAVSVDYSDAFKNARACEQTNASWAFQKTDITQGQEYVQDISMFNSASSSATLSSQPGKFFYF